jgi:hypothetical protein
MIRIRRVRLPESLQALARRENGAVVVYVSAALPASKRAAAIRRALRAAPEAGWRSPRSPVVLPALAGGAGLPLAPEGRWTYRALVAAAAAVVALVAAMVLAGGSSAPGSAHSSKALRPTASPAGPGPARAGGPGPGAAPGTGPGAAPGGAGQPGGKAGQPATAGQGPAPETSGQPTPVPTVTTGPSPRPSPAAARPSPSPSPSPASSPAGPGCVDVLGVRICL